MSTGYPFLHVYVIGCEGTRRVKIGGTDKAPSDRLKSLQTGAPGRLYILATVENMPIYGVENMLHKALAQFRRHGEWFDFGELDALGKIEDALAEMPGHMALDRKRDAALGREKLGTFDHARWARKHPEYFAAVRAIDALATALRREGGLPLRALATMALVQSYPDYCAHCSQTGNRTDPINLPVRAVADPHGVRASYLCATCGYEYTCNWGSVVEEIQW